MNQYGLKYPSGKGKSSEREAFWVALDMLSASQGSQAEISHRRNRFNGPTLAVESPADVAAGRRRRRRERKAVEGAYRAMCRRDAKAGGR